ncbi:hypothetical protein AMTR_s00093p00089580 [Amborella trichopoda]|uniref:Uncharacterized protein n=1 Tax=Amborella trichopoda TaxID=13333 RepID=W1NSP1_AMBTC|nr:hypothetical protein AMTR_s00093p00089580 [Amborella trichopoda]
MEEETIATAVEQGTRLVSKRHVAFTGSSSLQVKYFGGQDWQVLRFERIDFLRKHMACSFSCNTNIVVDLALSMAT